MKVFIVYESSFTFFADLLQDLKEKLSLEVPPNIMNPEYAIVLGLPTQASFLECSLLGTEAHSAGCCGPSSN